MNTIKHVMMIAMVDECTDSNKLIHMRLQTGKCLWLKRHEFTNVIQQAEELDWLFSLNSSFLYCKLNIGEE